MYCGNCLRDNALVSALRQAGHEATMLPLYLPLALDEANQSAGKPIFFGGINVFLEQNSAFFRKAPGWLHSLLSSPGLLKMVAGKAAKTRPEETGDLTISMLRGEEGRQARELDELVAWLKQQEKTDLFCLSNALLIGMARNLRKEFQTPVVCLLAGEESFLNSLPGETSGLAWTTLAERAAEIDLFIASSEYFAEVMTRRLQLDPNRVKVVYPGISMDGYAPAPEPPDPPVLGFFARMCRDKGLDTLVEAFLALRARGRINNLKLRIGGTCTPLDEPFVDSLRARLRSQGLLGEVEFFPNVDRATKQEFLRSLSVFSVPALYGEAFGLYLLEAWASGIPVVQPRHGAFPELIDATLGGVLCEPGDPNDLASAIEGLLSNVITARQMGESGRKAVLQRFTNHHMAAATLKVFEEARTAFRP